METKLERISQLSRENSNIVFTSIGHLINDEMLKDCHRKMDGSKAVGIDGITKEMYENNLDVNIQNLVKRLKNKSYKPKPARRVEIPKDNGKSRPLSIYCYEDKIVQEALRRILEAVFEPIFYDEMMGFRPNRGCHKAIKKLNVMIERKFTNYILDADIKGFFDHFNHKWLMKKEIIYKLNQMLVGYYHYYGITDNYRGIDSFYQETKRRLFYWLNRRGQRNSYTWTGFLDLLKQYPLVKPQIYVNVYDN